MTQSQDLSIEINNRCLHGLNGAWCSICKQSGYPPTSELPSQNIYVMPTENIKHPDFGKARPGQIPWQGTVIEKLSIPSDSTRHTLPEHNPDFSRTSVSNDRRDNGNSAMFKITHAVSVEKDIL